MKKNANLPALIFMFALLIAWQCIAMGMNAAYILPSPTQVLVRLWELRKPLFTAHLPATMLCTGVGLAISIALGLLLAIVMDANGCCHIIGKTFCKPGCLGDTISTHSSGCW